MFDFSMFDLTKGVSRESLLEQKRKLLEGKNLDGATKSYLEGLNTYSIDKLFKDYDKDGNGFITTDEASLIEVDFSDEEDDSEKISKEDFLKTDFPNLQGADLEKIFEYLDTDGDGLISKTELENLTLDEIQNFKPAAEGIKPEETTETPETNEVAPINDIGNDFDAGNYNYNSGGGGGGGGNYDAGTDKAGSLSEQIQQLEQQKGQERTNAETAIKGKEDEITAAIAEDEQVAALKEEYETKTKEIDDRLSEENIKLSQAKDDLMNTETAIADKTSRIEYKKERIGQLNSSISEKESEMNSLSTSTGDPEVDTANANKKSRLQSDIASLKDQLKQAEDEKEQLEAELTELEAKKTQLEADMPQIETAIKELEDQKEALLKEIYDKASPETQEKIDAIKEEIQTLKSNLETKIQEIDGKIVDLKAQLSAEEIQKEKDEARRAEILGSVATMTEADFALYGIKANQIGRFQRMTPEMQAATIDLLEYARQNGIHVSLTDTFRTNAEQADLYRRKPGLAARPGTSRHEFGLAIDISVAGGDANYTRLGNYWASRYGQNNWGGNWSSPHEPWHFQLNR